VVEEFEMATTPVEASGAPEPPGPINHLGRLIGVFFSPKPTFQDIAARPSWILPVVLMTVLGAGVAFVMNQKVDWRDVAAKRIEESPRAANLTPEQKEQQIALGAKVSPGFAWGFGICWPILQALIVGAVLLLAYNLIGGVGARFTTSMGIVSHAYFPWIFYSLLFILILYLKSPGTLDLDNPIATNLGSFLPESTPKALMSLGKSIDIFSFWTMFLISTGFAAVNPKKLAGKAFGIVLSVWGVFVVCKMALAWIFS
jgi:Yip1 domain